MMRAKGKIIVAVDKEGTVGREEMKVKIENRRIKAVTKKLKPSEADGEDIGVIKFSREGGEAFFNAIDEIIRRKGPHYDFQEAIHYLASKDYQVTYVNVVDEP